MDVSSPTVNTTSVSSATEPSETDNAPDPLRRLIERAAAADVDAVTSHRNRMLIREMAVALVAQARLIADLQGQAADKPQIVLP